MLEYCAKHLEVILYCGGDLPNAIGDAVASKIKLLNQFGASELGLTPQIIARDSPGEWKYAHFHPRLGLELRHVSETLHELYAIRDPKKRVVQPTFTIFPDVQEYASRDLFVRHAHIQISGVGKQGLMTLSFFLMAKRRTLFPWNSI